jgi:hypothetical protein
MLYFVFSTPAGKLIKPLPGKSIDWARHYAMLYRKSGTPMKVLTHEQVQRAVNWNSITESTQL